MLTGCQQTSNGSGATDAADLSADAGPAADAGPPGTFTQALVGGVCPVDETHIDISTVLLNGPFRALTPQSRVRGLDGPVGESLTAAGFRFTQTDAGSALNGDGFVEHWSETGLRHPVDLTAESVEFLSPGNAETSARPRLVVFLIDHSGSLAGIDRTGRFEAGTETDRNDQRVTFFRQLLATLPATDQVSLVWFDAIPRILSEYATPTLDRDVIAQGLENQVQFGETRGTDLAQALEATFDAVIQSNHTVSPVVVLFTDGVEDEASLDLSVATDRYAQRGVPIIVLDLQGKAGGELALGRDRKLSDLACATGGDYIYLQNAEELTTSATLLPLVVNRLAGAWKLRTAVDLGALPATDDLLLSTVLSVSLGGVERSFALEDASPPTDARGWFSFGAGGDR
jgi:Mg-chelatase subunit ChlD